MNMHISNLETERLILKEISEKDTDRIVEWRSNPDVYKYFLSPKQITRNEQLEWYQNSYLTNADRIDYMAALKSDGTSIGVFGLNRNNANSLSVEVSYILAPEAQGKGYAYEAVNKLTDFAKNAWKCNAIIAEVHKNNQKSINFISRCKFSQVSSNGNFLVFLKKI